VRPYLIAVFTALRQLLE